MLLRSALIALTVLWPLSEIALAMACRGRGRDATARDAGSLRGIWLSVAIGIPLAILGSGLRRAGFGIPESTQVLIALVLLVVGLTIRWSAIVTLGRFFTVNVAIQSGHQVVREGPFRFVRHPSYLGAMLCMFGVGVAFGNWISLAAATIPYTIAILRRIEVEERVLVEALGDAYREYARTTRRLLPGVY
ncbi:MAG TPA: isoprenylcysteine carboxylmethyltransferase family protein [Candidatus Eisenbacteria bacterium]|jgi:protein-S-isoprenylcysteine O-methyltransferase Ste14